MKRHSSTRSASWGHWSRALAGRGLTLHLVVDLFPVVTNSQMYPWLNYGGILAGVRLRGLPAVHAARVTLRAQPNLESAQAAFSAAVLVLEVGMRGYTAPDHASPELREQFRAEMAAMIELAENHPSVPRVQLTLQASLRVHPPGRPPACGGSRRPEANFYAQPEAAVAHLPSGTLRAEPITRR